MTYPRPTLLISNTNALLPPVQTLTGRKLLLATATSLLLASPAMMLPTTAHAGRSVPTCPAWS